MHLRRLKYPLSSRPLPQTLCSATSHGPQAYALSRDNGFPLSSIWSRLPKNRVPVYALWMSVVIGICFVIPVISTAYIFYALTSIATVGWIAAYSVPIFFRLIQPEDQFKPGPFYMARYIGVWGG